MATYHFEAIDDRGKKKSGLREADSPRALRQQLRDQGWMPVDVEVALSSSGSSSWLRRGPSLSTADLALITRQFSTLVAASLPLEECLSAVAEQNDKTKIRKLMLQVRSKVLEGYSLGESMAYFPRAFSELYRATIAAGEQSGHLDTVLLKLADYVENQNALRKSILLAAIYPVILVVVAVAVIVYLLQRVVPRILDVFISSQQALPAATEWLLAVTEWIGQYGLFSVPATIILIWYWRWWNKNPRRRKMHDYVLLKLPLIRHFSIGFNTSRYASTLSILGASGVPLVEAMRISSQVVINRVIRSAVEDAEKQVSEGGSLAVALKSTGFFSPMMVHMIANGEASGQLDQMLSRTAAEQEKTLQDTVRVMVALLEPLMLVLMGIMVLIIVMAVVLPITQMNTGIS